MTLRPVTLRVKFCLCQVQDPTFALTLLCSNNCYLIKVTWSCSKTDLIFRILCTWLSIKTIVSVHHRITNSPDFFIQALKLQPITLFHTATCASEHFVSLLLRAASREATSTICMFYTQIPTHQQNSLALFDFNYQAVTGTVSPEHQQVAP